MQQRNHKRGVKIITVLLTAALRDNAGKKELASQVRR
jgi:hypothetical protein